MTPMIRWKKEALGTNGIGLTQKMVDWCINERFKAHIFANVWDSAAYRADVVKSDSAISEELRTALLKSVKSLRDVSSGEQDWHPGQLEGFLTSSTYRHCHLCRH